MLSSNAPYQLVIVGTERNTRWWGIRCMANLILVGAS